MGFSMSRALALTAAMSGFGCGGYQGASYQRGQDCRPVGSRDQVMCAPLQSRPDQSTFVSVTGGKNGGYYSLPTPQERAVIAREFMRFDNR